MVDSVKESVDKRELFRVRNFDDAVVLDVKQ